jgi:hypothetical protein
VTKKSESHLAIDYTETTWVEEIQCDQIEP